MIGISIVYSLKDQMTGGLTKIKQAFADLQKPFKELSLSSAKLFGALKEQIPFRNTEATI
ncbi:MAG: hypothetical protein MUE85_12190 [Microscillaceae bacterium]|jgi:hypothetical protein|nr:hypothetical protein [Microscillaceae bacterium]